MASDFAYYYALWKMGDLSSEEVPGIACAALQQGLDSPALKYLAGLHHPSSREIGGLFDDACSQLGIVAASADEVERRQSEAWLSDAAQTAKRISADILNGTLDPAEGWLQLPYRDEELGPLAVFFEFAQPDGPVHCDKQFRSRVIEAAKRFQASAEYE